jgi:peptide/nickel transport system permease protein
MLTYFVRRVLYLIPVLLGVSLLTFLIAKVTPGDPARMMAGMVATQETIDRLHVQLHLDDPVWMQYGRFLWNASHGDFGVSYRGQKPVIRSILSRFPKTLELTLAAISITILVGIPTGILAARKRGGFLDRFVLVSTTTMLSIPIFWLAIVLLYIFGVYLNWINVTGNEGLKGLILPALCLSVGSGAYLTRLTRASILEVLGEDYVRTANSKGLARPVVMNRHVLRNALIPVVTFLGMSLAGMLGGAVFIENVFGRSGLGRFMINAIGARDLPEITGSVLFLATVFVCMNIVVDLIYAVIDPRIRYS